jgi:LAO/AO transport system kinase
VKISGAGSDVNGLAASIRSGDRKALAHAITLVESTRAPDRLLAERLLTALLPSTGNAIRLGISGTPGAGKSTLIETLGGHITQRGRTLAVLAIDPTSSRSGGSILGDKTRMAGLARNPAAFIRPTPAGQATGGVARRTREAMLLAEAAGFDVVMVETVGVGQSEIAVAELVDLFVLLVSPGGGDVLQGIKRGAMELADMVVVTKSDGDLAEAAARALADFRASLSLMRPKFADMMPRIVKVSAVTGAGIGETWNELEELAQYLRSTGRLSRLREDQLRAWFWCELRTALVEAVSTDPVIGDQAARMEAAVLAGEALPDTAARDLIGMFRGLDAMGSRP